MGTTCLPLPSGSLQERDGEALPPPNVVLLIVRRSAHRSMLVCAVSLRSGSAVTFKLQTSSLAALPRPRHGARRIWLLLSLGHSRASL
uniref:Uncharacterized protein n=1 Tax=Zea mays TaxID=4577 RepID=B4FBS6_MAIZE|nr:unknown [Zea mays]